jgi:hypothetical protein
MISALARIESNRGNLMDSFLILKEHQARFKPESPIWQKINEQLYSLKAEIDLSCLNSNQNNCSKIDLDGAPYKILNLKYQASKTWIPYRPKWVHK